MSFPKNMRQEEIDDLKSKIAFGGSTYDLIRWDALHRRLENSPPPITDAERCNVLLHIANGDAITARQWSSLMGAETLVAPPGKVAPLSESQRRWIVDALQLRVDEEHEKYAKEIRAVATSSVLLVPGVSVDQPRFTVIARDAIGALAYALSLFMDPTQRFGDELCRCQFEPCGRFYFVKRKPGRPARSYCCMEHGEGADKLKSRGRAADRYATKKQRNRKQESGLQQKRVAR